MARTSLNLPSQLKEDAEEMATRQGVSLNQFIVWAVAEKVGSLKARLDDPRFPHIAYQTGAAGWPVPVVRGSGLRVQTLAVAARQRSLSEAEIAAEYGLSPGQVREALAFYDTHRAKIDAAIETEQRLEPADALMFDEEAMREAIDCARGRLPKTSAEWLDETRGLAEEEKR